jgi:hypothetical protein
MSYLGYNKRPKGLDNAKVKVGITEKIIQEVPLKECKLPKDFWQPPVYEVGGYPVEWKLVLGGLNLQSMEEVGQKWRSTTICNGLQNLENELQKVSLPLINTTELDGYFFGLNNYWKDNLTELHDLNGQFKTATSYAFSMPNKKVMVLPGLEILDQLSFYGAGNNSLEYLDIRNCTNVVSRYNGGLGNNNHYKAGCVIIANQVLATIDNGNMHPDLLRLQNDKAAQITFI